MMRTPSISLAALVVIVLFSASSADADATCKISEQKKLTISALLCGQMSKETQYRFEGTDCFKKSLRARFRDTAIQILGAKMCGDDDLANKIKSANLRVLNFLGIMSVCTSEQVNLSSILDESLDTVSRELANERCTPEVRAVFAQRRPFFEQMISMSMDPNINSLMYEKLGVVVDGSGNISDK